MGIVYSASVGGRYVQADALQPVQCLARAVGYGELDLDLVRRVAAVVDMPASKPLEVAAIGVVRGARNADVTAVARRRLVDSPLVSGQEYGAGDAVAYDVVVVQPDALPGVGCCSWRACRS